MTERALGRPQSSKEPDVYRQPDHANRGGLAVIGAVVNFAFGRPAIRLIGSAAAFLTVSALWRLVFR